MPVQHAAALLTEGQQSLAAYGVMALVGLFLVAYVGFIIAAIISALASKHSFGMKLVWLVFIFIAPFIGALCWFFIGRRNVPVMTH
ncbi:hypothetical protein GCM10027570_56030 [Streptomonospora sediminis]